MNTEIIINKIKKDHILSDISKNFDGEIFLVGGSIRDILFGKNLIDRDLIIINKDARDFSIEVAKFFNATFVPLDEVNKIYRVVFEDKINYLDITNPVENSLEKDIFRRDLTINAICLNIKTGEIIDPTSGLKDFENKIIKQIEFKNFIDDPLRLLRVFRFYSNLGFKISEDLTFFIKDNAKLILNPAKERIEYEIMKLFCGEFAHCALLKMDECGLLEFLFPFVKELKQVPPNAHHHLDLFHHSLETVKQIQQIYNCSDDIIKKHLEKVDFGGFSRLAHLKLAGFMHDIGKFSTWFIEKETGRHRFYKHEEIGAQMCPQILKNLAFSNKQISYIKTIIKNHMYATMVVCSPQLTDKIMMRFVRKAGEDAIDMITIAKSDRLSALGPEITKEIVEENLTMLTKLQDFYIKSLDNIKPLPKLLDGNEIMEIFNINPSPLLGEILNELHEAQINGDINSKQEAIDFVKNFIINAKNLNSDR